MSDFITNTKEKLSYAYAPKRYNLDPFASTEITTTETVSTLATHSATKFRGADLIKFGYLISTVNASGNNEEFEYVAYFGGNSTTATLTTVNAENDFILVEGELVRINSTKFLATVTITQINNGLPSDLTVVKESYTITDSSLNEITITAKNTSTISAGFDLEGVGGYLVVDTFEAY